ncbi:MAG: hypothetical protein WCZ87_07195 [Thiohalobacteraceae bacterium]
MIITTTDPISGKEVSDPENHPFLIEGEGEYALKMYFESEATKRAYQDHAAQFSDDGFS